MTIKPITQYNDIMLQLLPYKNDGIMFEIDSAPSIGALRWQVWRQMQRNCAATTRAQMINKLSDSSIFQSCALSIMVKANIDMEEVVYER